MKFRMIFLGAEQDPDGGTVPELDADIPVDESSLRCYEYSGTHMVRRDQLANGRVRRTPVANFRARIVSDIIRDDGAQQQREFGVEAELGGAAKSLPCRQRSSAGWAGCSKGWDHGPSSIRDSNSMCALPCSPYPGRFIRNTSCPFGEPA